jgi:hypothetical protein
MTKEVGSSRSTVWYLAMNENMSIRRWSMLWRCVCVAAPVLLIALALYVGSRQYSSYHNDERVERRLRDFRGVIMAIEASAAETGYLPNVEWRNAFGQPCGSWRGRVLGWLDDSAWFSLQDPWFLPCNSLLQNVRFRVFCDSLDEAAATSSDTTIWAISGRGTAFDNEQPRKLSELPGDLILLIEVANSGTYWLETGDLDVESVPSSITCGTKGDGVIVAFADGTVWFLDRSVPLATLRSFFTITGANLSDRDIHLKPFLKFSLPL